MNDLVAMIEEATTILSQQPLLREIEGKAIVSGDIHGDIDALKQIINKYEKEEADTLVFLGDYVDRGKYQLEVIEKLVQMIIEGINVIVLRGNHEDELVCTNYGFSDVVEENDMDLEVFTEFFSHLPFAAISSNAFFCHGGIPVAIDFEPGDIVNFEREAIIDETSDAIELVWNDPNTGKNADKKRKVFSLRGTGWKFGQEVTDGFLTNNGLNFVVRAHQAFDQGYKWIHKNKILSLFTSSSGPYKFKSRKIAYFDLDNQDLKKEDIKIMNLVSKRKASIGQ